MFHPPFSFLPSREEKEKGNDEKGRKERLFHPPSIPPLKGGKRKDDETTN
jgi:hypothetical protein